MLFSSLLPDDPPEYLPRKSDTVGDDGEEARRGFGDVSIARQPHRGDDGGRDDDGRGEAILQSAFGFLPRDGRAHFTHEQWQRINSENDIILFVDAMLSADPLLAQSGLHAIPACDEGMTLLRVFAERSPDLHERAAEISSVDRRPACEFGRNPFWQAFTEHWAHCDKCKEV